MRYGRSLYNLDDPQLSAFVNSEVCASNMPLPSRKVIKSRLVDLLSQNGKLHVDEIYGHLAEFFSLTDVEKSAIRSGDLLYKHEIRWAKQELVQEGLIARPEVSGRGQWQLFGDGLSAVESRPDELDRTVLHLEGSVIQVLVNRYERSPAARLECLTHHGYSCCICNYDFESCFGMIGENVIHVHHLHPISSIGVEYQLDPIRDLVPICPNCHHMIHRRDPPFSISELKEIMVNNSNPQ
jgi:5-methylcytosine-specific restriction enzyme A